MKINDKLLSIPPYVSTPWTNVTSLRVEGVDLVVHMNDGTEARVPNLDGETLERIFEQHAEVLEQGMGGSAGIVQDATSGVGTAMEPPPFQIGFEGMAGMGSAMAHNPDQSDAPDLPQEILEKVARVAQIVAPSEAKDLPKPEPHCNCVYCQIARAIQQAMDGEDFQVTHESDDTSDEEEEVTEEDLSFCEWNIKQSGEQLFTVSNPLDESEAYQVFLGHPVGCTCGHTNCEHIVAVLRS